MKYQNLWRKILLFFAIFSHFEAKKGKSKENENEKLEKLRFSSKILKMKQEGEYIYNYGMPGCDLTTSFCVQNLFCRTQSKLTDLGYCIDSCESHENKCQGGGKECFFGECINSNLLTRPEYSHCREKHLASNGKICCPHAKYKQGKCYVNTGNKIVKDSGNEKKCLEGIAFDPRIFKIKYAPPVDPLDSKEESDPRMENVKKSIEDDSWRCGDVGLLLWGEYDSYEVAKDEEILMWPSIIHIDYERFPLFNLYINIAKALEIFFPILDKFMDCLKQIAIETDKAKSCKGKNEKSIKEYHILKAIAEKVSPEAYDSIDSYIPIFKKVCEGKNEEFNCVVFFMRKIVQFLIQFPKDVSDLAATTQDVTEFIGKLTEFSLEKSGFKEKEEEKSALALINAILVVDMEKVEKLKLTYIKDLPDANNEKKKHFLSKKAHHHLKKTLNNFITKGLISSEKSQILKKKKKFQKKDI